MVSGDGAGKCHLPRLANLHSDSFLTKDQRSRSGFGQAGCRRDDPVSPPPEISGEAPAAAGPGHPEPADAAMCPSFFFSFCYLPATQTVFRPAFLAANSARSAAMSTVAASTPSPGEVDTPAEMVKRPRG